MLPIFLLFILPVIYPGNFKRIVLLLTPFFGVAVSFFFLFQKNADKAGFTSTNSYELTLFNLERKIVLASQIPFFYLKKFLMPYKLSVAYEPDFAPNILSYQVVLAVTALSAALFLAVFFRRRFPDVAIGVLWFFASLLQVLHFF